MTVEFAHGVVSCGGCERVLRRGEWVYRVTKQRLVRCEDCARRHGGPLPAPTVAEPSTPQPLNLERFNRFQVAGHVRASILDWRAKRSGELV